MMSDIMLIASCFFYLILQIVILQVLHFKQVVIFLKPQIFLLFDDQPCHDVIHQKCSCVYKEKSYGVLWLQSKL